MPHPSSHRSRFSARFAAPLALAAVVVIAGCSEKKASRLELDPPEKMAFRTKGKKTSIRVGVYDERDKPFIRQPKIDFSSSDTTVAEVDEKGVVTSTGSGDAEITVSTLGVSASLKVEVRIVGGIEFAKDMQTEARADPDKRLPIKFIVKDDKGRPMKDHPKVRFETTSACADAYSDATWVPYMEGECSLIARCLDFEASVRLKVKK
jgi:hypothetical protein